MTPTPGSGIDLDRAVADALVRNEPNTCIGTPYSDRMDSLLMLVAMNGRTDLTKALLEAGATMTGEEFDSVLWWWPRADIVTCLLEHNLTYATRGLQNAVRHAQWNVVEILLDHGADINQRLTGGYLLHIVAWQGEQTFLETLLRRGADIHRRDADGLTPLMKACDYVRNDHMATPRIVETLLQHGSDPHAISPKGETPLLLCVAQQLPDNPERTEIARVLLRYGAEPNWPSQNGTTPLMLAARDNNLPLATALVEAHASPQLKTPDGRTARDIAMQYKAHDVLAFLQSLPE